YIAHQIMEMHGGTLTLQPAPGKGTIAEVTVPLLLESPESEEDEQVTVQTGPASSRRRARYAGRRKLYTTGTSGDSIITANGNGNGADHIGENAHLNGHSNGNGNGNGKAKADNKDDDIAATVELTASAPSGPVQKTPGQKEKVAK